MKTKVTLEEKTRWFGLTKSFTKYEDLELDQHISDRLRYINEILEEIQEYYDEEAYKNYQDEN